MKRNPVSGWPSSGGRRRIRNVRVFPLVPRFDVEGQEGKETVPSPQPPRLHRWRNFRLPQLTSLDLRIEGAV